eukprot:18327-Heterococcus_DN1.PRE.5
MSCSVRQCSAHQRPRTLAHSRVRLLGKGLGKVRSPTNCAADAASYVHKAVLFGTTVVTAAARQTVLWYSAAITEFAVRPRWLYVGPFSMLHQREFTREEGSTQCPTCLSD